MKCFARAVLISAVLAAGLGVRDSSAQSATAAPTMTRTTSALLIRATVVDFRLDPTMISPRMGDLRPNSLRYAQH